VRTELGRWSELAEELERDAATQADAMLSVGSLVRAGEIWTDHLRSPERAIACYERVLERDPEHLGALLAIETLYRQVGKLAELAELHERQERVFTDMGAKAAAHRERARAMMLAGLGDSDERVACYSAILAVRPRDHLALADLEREALASRDPRVIASVDARLAQVTGDATLRAAYLARRAEALEIAGQPQALDVFREALADDPDSLAALRGMARVAEVIGDGAAMVEAARQEAVAARDPRASAEAWARSGGVHADLLGEPEAAIEDFAEALLCWPDHAVAAARLTELMRAAGQIEQLAERLGRAAVEATQKDRKSALAIEVAELYAGELGNLGAGLAALERLLASQPNDVRALLTLARFYVEDRRHPEAIDVLKKCVALDADAKVRLRVHDLSAAAYQALGDSAAAFRHYEQALALAPDDRRLLARVFDLQMNAGMSAAAADIASRLLQLSGEGPARAVALIALGRARASSRKIGDAIEAFVQAVVLEGPGGTAGSEFAKLATEPEHWRAYVDALRRHLGHAGVAGPARAALHLEIARVLAERLGAEDEAMTVLAEGLHATGDPGLRYELALRLRQRRRHVEAIEQLQGVIMDDVARIEAWRLLGQAYEELQRPRERVMTLAGLVVLGSASAREVEEVRRWQPWTSAIRPGSLANDAAADLYIARDQQSAPSALLASIVEGLAKVRPPELSHYGVSSRDRLPPKSDHPLRQLVDPLAAAFAVEEFELFLHGQRDRGLVVENTAKPSVLVPLWLGELPRTQQVYALAQALCSLARGLHVIDLFSPRELEILFAAAIRGMVPSFGDRVANADVLDDQGKLIQRGITRKKRRAYEVSAEACARLPSFDVATFVQWTRQTSRRVALVVADDLISSITYTTRTEETGGRAGIALARHSPVIGDLLRSWVSKPAMALRRHCGMVAPSSSAAPGGGAGPRA
jgi:tetratricopeptide (TPR) repeat protein